MAQEIQQALNDLKAQVAVLTSTDASAIALINGQNKLILDAVNGASDDAAAVAAVRDVVATLTAQNAQLAAAVAQNTPSAPAAPPAPAVP